MPNDTPSGLPSPEGSPFRTGNFNKFFFGILIATILLLALFFAFFRHRVQHAEPPPPHSSALSPLSGSAQA